MSKRLMTVARKNFLLRGRNLEQNWALGGWPAALTSWVERERERERDKQTNAATTITTIITTKNMTNNSNIHPLSITLILNSGGAGANPSCHWASGGVHPGQVARSVTGPTYRDKHSHIQQFRVMSLDCGHEENMQTPHRRAPVGWWVQTQNPLAVRWQC